MLQARRHVNYVKAFDSCGRRGKGFFKADGSGDPPARDMQCRPPTSLPNRGCRACCLRNTVGAQWYRRVGRFEAGAGAGALRERRLLQSQKLKTRRVRAVFSTRGVSFRNWLTSCLEIANKPISKQDAGVRISDSAALHQYNCLLHQHMARRCSLPVMAMHPRTNQAAGKLPRGPTLACVTCDTAGIPWWSSGWVLNNDSARLSAAGPNGFKNTKFVRRCSEEEKRSRLRVQKTHTWSLLPPYSRA